MDTISSSKSFVTLDWALTRGKEGKREGRRAQEGEERRLVPLNGSDHGGAGGGGRSGGGGAAAGGARAGAGKKGESSLVIGSERPPRSLPPSLPRPRPPRHRLFTGFFRHPRGRHKALLPLLSLPQPMGREIRCTRNGFTKYDERRKMQFSADSGRVTQARSRLSRAISDPIAGTRESGRR